MDAEFKKRLAKVYKFLLNLAKGDEQSLDKPTKLVYN